MGTTARLCDDDKDEKVNAIVCRYELSSVVCHHGDSPDTGHYVIFAKSQDLWLLKDDTHVSSFRKEEMTEKFEEEPFMTPYILTFV